MNRLKTVLSVLTQLKTYRLIKMNKKLSLELVIETTEGITLHTGFNIHDLRSLKGAVVAARSGGFGRFGRGRYRLSGSVSTNYGRDYQEVDAVNCALFPEIRDTGEHRTSVMAVLAHLPEAVRSSLVV